MFEHGLNLLTTDPGKPLEELIDGGAVLKVLEKCPDRTRVPLKVHTPVTFAGSRSTAMQWLQSSMLRV
jgi:hypothetical protein